MQPFIYTIQIKGLLTAIVDQSYQELAERIEAAEQQNNLIGMKWVLEYASEKRTYSKLSLIRGRLIASDL